jgi:hypothetical protein
MSRSRAAIEHGPRVACRDGGERRAAGATAQTLISGGSDQHLHWRRRRQRTTATRLKSLRSRLDQVSVRAPMAIGDVGWWVRSSTWPRHGRGSTGCTAQAPLVATPSAEAPAPVAAATPSTPPTTPFAVTLKHASISEGTVNYADDSAGRFRLQVVNLGAEASALSTTSRDRGKVRVTGDIAEGGGSATLEGDVGLAPVAGRLALTARDVKLRSPARYLANVVNATLDGASDVDGVVEFAASEPAMEIKVRDLAVRSRAISVRGPAGSGANFDLDTMALDGGELDSRIDASRSQSSH